VCECFEDVVGDCLFVGMWVVEVLCVVVWCLWFGFEIDYCIIVYEVDWLCFVVYLCKGCYWG